MNLYWITCAVSLGGLLFGFDTGVISGCEEAIQNEFSLAPFWHGLVVAGALIGTVFGALAGWFVLGETLSARELAGCALMGAGMLASQAGGYVFASLKKRRRRLAGNKG